MRSKNSKPHTKAELLHLELVKSSGCAVCDAGPFVEAHHIVQGDHWTCIGLCQGCHTGPMGIHGDKTMWRIAKLDEIGALNVTLSRIYG